MKKLILVGVSVFALSFSAFAQQGNPSRKTPQERAAHQSERLSKELSLTPEQAARVKAILEKRGAQMDSVRAKKMAGVEKSEVRSERKAARESTEEELKAVLTPEQYAKYQAMKEEMKAKHHEGGKKKEK